MTTIVADKTMCYMAADRMVTTNDGEIAISCETKIEEVSIGGDLYLVGLAGLEGPGLYFLEWFKDGSWDEPPEPISVDAGEEFSILILGPHTDPQIQVADRFCRLSRIDHRWYAVGSGGTHAWAILEAGVGVDKAMATAIKMDPNSGFGYQVRHLVPEQREYDRDVDT